MLKTLGLLGVPDPVKLRLYRLKRVRYTAVHSRETPSSGPYTMWAGIGSEKQRAGGSSMLEAEWRDGVTEGVGNGGSGFTGAGGTGYRIDRLGVGMYLRRVSGGGGVEAPCLLCEGCLWW